MDQDHRARVREQAGVWVRVVPVAGKVRAEEVRVVAVVAEVVAGEPARVRDAAARGGVGFNLKKSCYGRHCIMPGFNGTGPAGLGEMTGRGRGYCISNILPGTRLAAWGSRGAQRGWGWRHSDFTTGMLAGLGLYLVQSFLTRHFAPAISGRDELNLLKEEVSYLENALAQAKSCVKELENKEGLNNKQRI
ncbi:MAG: DUF5320 domain-containing protein [Desulfotomaculaceae bacterium]|nr:DUF5320 domain-containing protein [Desulfotomaculaceae bacterium]